MSNEVVELAKESMEERIGALKRELTKIRTGRASRSLLDGIKVNAYGSSLPVDQVGTITIPESRMIVIQPWDPQMLAVLEKAIMASDIGLYTMIAGGLLGVLVEGGFRLDYLGAPHQQKAYGFPAQRDIRVAFQAGIRSRYA